MKPTVLIESSNDYTCTICITAGTSNMNFLGQDHCLLCWYWTYEAPLHNVNYLCRCWV